MGKTQNKPVYHAVDALNLDPKLINPAAIETVRALGSAGYQAYLVGGCVRDLLLGVTPKDFDISTSATPNQVRRVFKRARIIGQRFKIVHVNTRGELFEISTFRQAVKAHHKDRNTGQVLDDNVYGTIEDDASRRDFTINALYYDVKARQIIDYFDGIKHIRQKKLVLIGEPNIRYVEDPGRILRTVRFQSKFDFKLAREIIEAIHLTKHYLHNIPPARRFDEVLKLFYCGRATRMWELLNEYKLLPYLFAYAESTSSSQSKLSRSITTLALANTDQRVGEGKPVISAFMFCAILWPYYHHTFKQLIQRRHDPQESMIQASEQVIAQQLLRTGMLRRVTNTIRDIWWLQYRLEKSTRKSTAKIIAHPRFRAAYDFLLIRAQLGDVDKSLAEFWTRQQLGKTSSSKPAKKIKSDHERKRRRSRRNAHGRI